MTSVSSPHAQLPPTRPQSSVWMGYARVSGHSRSGRAGGSPTMATLWLPFRPMSRRYHPDREGSDTQSICFQGQRSTVTSDIGKSSTLAVASEAPTPTAAAAIKQSA